MLYHSNCKCTLNLCRATDRQAVKRSCTTVLVTLVHMFQVVQDSRQLLIQQGEEEEMSPTCFPGKYALIYSTTSCHLHNLLLSILYPNNCFDFRPSCLPFNFMDA